RWAVTLSWICWLPAVLIVWHAFLVIPFFADWIQTFYLDKFVALASFLGGCTVFLFFTPWLLWQQSRRAFEALTLFAAALFLLFHTRLGGFDVVQSATLAFFIGSTAAFLILLSLGRPSLKSARTQVLRFWLALGLLELIVIMPWTAGRYLLLVLPPVCWLFRAMLEETGQRRLWALAWGTTALFGAALAYVDYAQAGVIVPL